MDPAQLLAEFPEVLEFLFKPMRYKVAWGGRGGTKSWGFAMALLIIGLFPDILWPGRKSGVRILCARETMESIAQSVHQTLRDQIIRLGINSDYDVQKSSIIGRKMFEDGSQTLFTFAGLAHNVHNIKSLEAYDIVWIEEAQGASKDSWNTLIPTIRKEWTSPITAIKETSEIWVSFNPNLVSDETYFRFILNPPKRSYVVKTGWQDNPWFPETLKAELEEMREKDYDEYLHVYEGQCKQNVEGAIFRKEMQAATAEGRIGKVPYNKLRSVDTVWDLGFDDMTAIWFVQSYDGFFHFIDYEEGDGLTIADYLIKLQERKYVYGTHWLPHDGIDTIIHKKLAGGDRTRSIEMIMREAGLNVRVVPKLTITDGLNAARTIFPACRFDEWRCSRGIDCLRNYQWGPITALGVRRREPLHNWASHGSDAFRMASVALKQPKKEPEKKIAQRIPYNPQNGYIPFG